MTEALRNINKVAGLFKNDYDFAMKLISVPLPDRYDWLNNMIYDKMRLSEGIALDGGFRKWKNILN